MLTRSLIVSVFLVATLSPFAVHAQATGDPLPAAEPAALPPAPTPAAPSPAPQAPPPPPAPAPIALASPVTTHREPQDANIDRTFLLPTAETQPKGSLTFSDYELLLLGLTYAVTDNFQFTGTTLVPLHEDMPFVGQISAKLQLLDEGRLKVAALAGLWFVNDENDYEGDSENDLVVGSLGGAASYCLDETCAGLLSASATLSHSNQDDEEILLYGASLVHPLTRRIKLLLELDTATAFHDGESDDLDGYLFGYGLRFFQGDIAGDVGFLKPVGQDFDGDELPLGIPFVNFSYRSL